MKIAVQGCAHGELENIYDTIEYIERQSNITIDLLLCCGDFQATRNLDDLKSMAAPPKFRSLCTFYKYYSGEKLAPKLTIFIGGNHEASNYLQELPYGGWVAPNIYYLGYAGVVNVAGIRIGGLSGIFKGWDFPKGRYEKPPYNEETLRSCYHIRNLDVFRLKQLSHPINIMLSHDWPAGITNHGNVKNLLKAKPFFREEIDSEKLGNKPAAELLGYLKPDYWFAAHLHVKFAALVKHNESEPKVTRFLSLDKCLPRRKFLQVVDVPHNSESEIKLKYDLEWLTILHITNHLTSVEQKSLPVFKKSKVGIIFDANTSPRWVFKPTKEELDLVMKKFHNDLVIPKNFIPTAPAHNSDKPDETGKQPKFNPQTIEFCEKLGVDDPISLLLNEDGFHNSSTINISGFETSSFMGDFDADSPSTEKSFTRTPLKLPQPTFDVSDSGNENSASGTVEKLNVSLSESCATPTDSSLVNESDDSTSTKDKTEESVEPGPKKFKRRNMAIYASREDDD